MNIVLKKCIPLGKTRHFIVSANWKRCLLSRLFKKARKLCGSFQSELKKIKFLSEDSINRLFIFCSGTTFHQTEYEFKNFIDKCEIVTPTANVKLYEEEEERFYNFYVSTIYIFFHLKIILPMPFTFPYINE